MDEDTQVLLREEETRLTKILIAIQNLAVTKEWKDVKEVLIEGLIIKLEDRLKNEAKKSPIEVEELYKIQGEIRWARQYADLNKYASTLKEKLLAVKKKLR